MKEQSGKLPLRSEIDQRFQWKLSDIFPTDEAWEKAYHEVENEIPKISAFSGKLGESPEVLLNALQTINQIEPRLYLLYLYAGLKSDQDTSVPKYQGYRDKVTSLAVKWEEACAFLRPEILEIPEKTLQQFLESSEGLQEYRHYLENIVRTKAHTLTREQEQLLAMSGEIAQAPYHIFSMFNNADIKFPTIIDENGREVEVTKGRINVLLESPDRRVRFDAYQAMYGEYRKWLNTLSATLTAAVKRNIFYARARKYSTALEAALDGDNIPPTVYDNVTSTIETYLPTMHRYMQLRKQLLGVTELKPWDLYVPLFADVKITVPYEEAVELVQKGLAPLGAQYQKDLSQAFRNGWIDVFENRGKRSGAYSWSTYGVHPYILLNYNETLDNVFTLAHELGHAMHSFYTHQHQPYHYSHYTIFVAEVASTLNESLLMDYLLKTTDDPQQKLYLLNQYIDTIRGTLYGQALFATFEKEIHRRAESGEALTVEVYSSLMRDLYTRYYGDAFVMDEHYPNNWCRIPHFYYNFYVYQYATGLSAAITLSQKILAGDQTARDAYLRFLSRGNSAYSIDLLKDAGVDMTSPEPIAATAKLMDQLLDEVEKLLAELKTVQ